MIKKKIPYYIPILDIVAMIKQAQSWIFEKAGFHSMYKLMQTLLDWPEFIWIHYFIEYKKDSCLKLQFILSKMVKQAKNIPKTIIFVSNISDI